MIRARTPVPLLSLILAFSLAGCASAPASAPVPTREPDVAQADRSPAEAVYRSYLAASNAVDLADPATFAPLAEFTSGQFHDDEHAVLSRMHAEGHVAGGAIVMKSFRAERSSGGGAVVATACNDASDLTLVDSRGESLVPSDSPDAFEMRLEFIPIDGELRLDSSVVTARGSGCPVAR